MMVCVTHICQHHIIKIWFKGLIDHMILNTKINICRPYMRFDLRCDPLPYSGLLKQDHNAMYIYWLGKGPVDLFAIYSPTLN